MVSPEKLPALTSLRFFAAAAIVFFHIAGQPGLQVQVKFALPQAVSFFFVLSGFILTYNYPAVRTTADRKRFMIARVARIWPAYVVSIVAMVAIVPEFVTTLNPLRLTRTLVANLPMIQTWLPVTGFTFSINGPSWTIATEFGLYIAFLLLISDFARTWWWKLGTSLLIAAMLIVIATAFELPWYDPRAYFDSAALLYLHPLARLFEFVVGMCAGMMQRETPFKIRGGFVTWTLLEATAVLIVMAVSKASFLYPGSTPFGWWLGMGAMAVPAAALIFVMAQARGLISRLLCLSPAVFLGEISYSIYLLHVPVSFLIFVRLKGQMSDGHALAAYVAVTLAASALTWMLVERPARFAIRRALGGSLGGQRLGESAVAATR